MKRAVCLLYMLNLFAASMTLADVEPISAELFRQQLIAELQQRAEQTAAEIDKLQARQSRPGRNLTYELWALCVLHQQTGQAGYADLARRGLIYWCRHYIGEDDQPGVSYAATSRNLSEACWTFSYLDGLKMMTEDDRAAVQQFMEISLLRSRAGDWGGHNRTGTEAMARYSAARAFPDSDQAEQWKAEAWSVSYDGFATWSIEDASIYHPFWLWQYLQVADLTGRSERFVKSPMFKYYCDYYVSLLTPAGYLPDWGDGDLFHLSDYAVACLVRASAAYRDGRYLQAAYRLYHATVADENARAAWNRVINPAALAEALRWMDVSVPMAESELTQSHEALEDLVGKKIVFVNPHGADSSYLLLNYRDLGPYGCYQRDYLSQRLYAFEEKQHHGHADENAVLMLMDQQTMLLHDGGYRRTGLDGWRADLFHNRIVARNGWPLDHAADHQTLLQFFAQNKLYQPVETRKIHFETLGPIDYSRTRLIEQTRGYTADRIVLFFLDPGMYIVVDSILIDQEGPKVFANLWHPESVLAQGTLDGELEQYVVSWPGPIQVREKTFANPHQRDLLIQFLDNRDKPAAIDKINRNYSYDSQCFYQWLQAYWFKGMRFNFVTVLRPHPAGQFDKDMLDDVQLLQPEHRDGRRLGLLVQLGDDRQATIGLKLDQAIGLTNLRGRPLFDVDTGSIRYADLTSDADFAFVLAHERQLDFGFVNGAKLDYRGQSLFMAKRDLYMNQGPTTFRVERVYDKMPRWMGSTTLQMDQP